MSIDYTIHECWYGSREDTIFILFLLPVTSSVGYITENGILRKIKIITNNKILLIVIIFALSSVLPREIMWSLCKEDWLLPSVYSILSDKFKHWKMAKKLKRVIQKRENNIGKERLGVLSLHVCLCALEQQATPIRVATQ